MNADSEEANKSKDVTRRRSKTLEDELDDTQKERPNGVSKPDTVYSITSQKSQEEEKIGRKRAFSRALSVDAAEDRNVRQAMKSKIRSNSVNVASVALGFPKPSGTLLKSILLNRAFSVEGTNIVSGEDEVIQRQRNRQNSAIDQLYGNEAKSFDNPMYEPKPSIHIDVTSVHIPGINMNETTEDIPAYRTKRMASLTPSLDSIGEFDGISERFYENGVTMTFEIDDNSTESNEDPKTNSVALQRRIMKNVVLVSIGFLCLFSCISSLAALQSSLNADGALGVIGLCVNFITVVLSCLFTPHLLIRFIGYKWAMTMSMTGTLPWIVANVYPTWATIIPANILLGK